MKGKQKKIPKRFLENKETWETNRTKILEIITSGRFSYTEIISKSPIGKTATLNDLKELEKDNLIDNERDGAKSYYILTKKGKETLNEIIRKHQEYLGGLKDTGSTYLHTRSKLGITMGICSLPWGIDPHMTINTKLEKLKLLRHDDIEEMEKLLFKKIAKNIKDIRKYSVKFGDDALDLIDKERFVLSFNVNLVEVYKSIEQKSLEKLEKMLDEEITAKFQAELDWMGNFDDSVLDENNTK